MSDFVVEPVKTERGWELSFNGGLESLETSKVYPTKVAAEKAALSAMNDYRTWNNRGLSDAPHMDNF